MSFLFELEVEGLTAEQAQAIARECEERGAWPLTCRAPRRRRFVLIGPHVQGPVKLGISEYLERGRHILSDDAKWDAPAWAMEPELLAPLAEAMRILGEELAQGFAFRATWVGSEVRREVAISAEGLAAVVLASRLNEFTRYRVPARARHGPT